MTAPESPPRTHPMVAFGAYLAFTAGVGLAAWHRIWWPALAGLALFVVLAVIAGRRTR